MEVIGRLILLTTTLTGVLSQSCDIRSHPCWAETTEDFRRAFDAEGFDSDILCGSDELHPLLQCVRDYRLFEMETGEEGEGDCVDHDLAAEVLEVLIESCRMECGDTMATATMCSATDNQPDEQAPCDRLTQKTECIRNAQPQCQLMDAVDDVIAYTKSPANSVAEDLALMGVGFSADELDHKALCLRRELVLQKRYEMAQQMAAVRQAADEENYEVNRRNMWDVYGGRAKRRANRKKRLSMTSTCGTDFETAATNCVGPLLEAMGLSLEDMETFDPVGTRADICSNLGVFDGDFEAVLSTTSSCYDMQFSGHACTLERAAMGVFLDFLGGFCEAECDNLEDMANETMACMQPLGDLTAEEVEQSTDGDSNACIVAQTAFTCATSAAAICGVIMEVFENMGNPVMAFMNPLITGSSRPEMPDNVYILGPANCGVVGVCPVDYETAAMECVPPVLEAMGLTMEDMQDFNPLESRDAICSTLSNYAGEFSNVIATASACYADEFTGAECVDDLVAMDIFLHFLENMCEPECSSIVSAAATALDCLSWMDDLSDEQAQTAQWWSDSTVCESAQTAAECVVDAVGDCSVISDVISNFWNPAVRQANPLAEMPAHTEIIGYEYCDMAANFAGTAFIDHCGVDFGEASAECVPPVLEAMGLTIEDMVDFDPVHTHDTICSALDSFGGDFNALVQDAASCFAGQFSGTDCAFDLDAMDTFLDFLNNFCDSGCNNLENMYDDVMACVTPLDSLSGSEMFSATQSDSDACSTVQSAATCVVNVASGCAAIMDVFQDIGNPVLANVNPLTSGSGMYMPEPMYLMGQDYCNSAQTFQQYANDGGVGDNGDSGDNGGSSGDGGSSGNSGSGGSGDNNSNAVVPSLGLLLMCLGRLLVQ